MASIGPNTFRKSFAVAATVQAYHIVSFDTVTASDGHVRVTHPWSETAHLLGISQDYADTTGAQFQAVPVISFGYAKVAAGASVSAGAILIAVTSTGYAIEGTALGNTGLPLTATFATTGSIRMKEIGIALEKASLTDAVMECYVNISNFRLRIV